MGVGVYGAQQLMAVVLRCWGQTASAQLLCQISNVSYQSEEEQIVAILLCQLH